MRKIAKLRNELQLSCIEYLLKCKPEEALTSDEVLEDFRKRNPKVFENTRGLYWRQIRNFLFEEKVLHRTGPKNFYLAHNQTKRLNELKAAIEAEMSFVSAPSEQAAGSLPTWSEIIDQIHEVTEAKWPDVAKALQEKISGYKRTVSAQLNRILELEAVINDPTRRLVNVAMVKKILDQRKEISELLDEQKQFRALIMKQEQRVKELEIENAKLWHDMDAMSDPASRIPPNDKKLLDDLGVDLNGQEAA
jgi:hypothetical protein